MIVSHDQIEMTYGIACHGLATLGRNIEEQLNTIMVHMTGEWNPKQFAPTNEMVRAVEDAQRLIIQFTVVMNRAAPGFVPVKTIRQEWVETLPEGHPDKTDEP